MLVINVGSRGKDNDLPMMANQEMHHPCCLAAFASEEGNKQELKDSH